MQFLQAAAYDGRLRANMWKDARGQPAVGCADPSPRGAQADVVSQGEQRSKISRASSWRPLEREIIREQNQHSRGGWKSAEQTAASVAAMNAHIVRR